MRRLLPVVPALLLMLGTTVACSDSSENDNGVATVDDSQTEAASGGETVHPTFEEQQAFVDCLREHGIDMPDPEPNEGGVVPDVRQLDAPLEELRPAVNACQPELNLDGMAGQPIDQETLAAMTEFAECMRASGVNVPDPDPNTGFQSEDGGTAFDPEDPDFQAGLEDCREELAQFRPGAEGGQ